MNAKSAFDCNPTNEIRESGCFVVSRGSGEAWTKPRSGCSARSMNDFDHREAAAHYQTLLASLYAWMVGARDVAREAAAGELRRLGIGPANHATTVAPRALDLGA